eukprot:2856925-Rhodomonas_salina.1
MPPAFHAMRAAFHGTRCGGAAESSAREVILDLPVHKVEQGAQRSGGEAQDPEGRRQRGCTPTCRQRPDARCRSKFSRRVPCKWALARSVLGLFRAFRQLLPRNPC